MGYTVGDVFLIIQVIYVSLETNTNGKDLVEYLVGTDLDILNSGTRNDV